MTKQSTHYLPVYSYEYPVMLQFVNAGTPPSMSYAQPGECYTSLGFKIRK